MKMKNKTRYGQAEIIKEYENGVRLLKFNGRFYTAYGRMFAVSGNHINTSYDEVVKLTHYEFCDWNELKDMFKNE